MQMTMSMTLCYIRFFVLKSGSSGDTSAWHCACPSMALASLSRLASSSSVQLWSSFLDAAIEDPGRKVPQTCTILTAARDRILN